jgi:hypothetical protein
MAQATRLPQLPFRVANGEQAQAQYPLEFQDLVPALAREDPLADALVAWADAHRLRPTDVFDDALALHLRGEQHGAPAANALVTQMLRKPAWLNDERLHVGGAALTRAALSGGLVLAFRSLIGGYAAPAGNKPLAFSGRLEAAAARRLDETGRFVRAVSLPGGLEPLGEGFTLTARVRLMHAGVRRLLQGSGRWDTQAWSAPINQHDMVATILLFSSVWLGGCRLLGIDFSAAEASNHMQLWRYVGFLMGVEDELLPTSEAHATRQAAFIRLTQHAPDDDSRRLVRALMQPPPTSSRRQRLLAPLWADYINGLCHVLLDEELCVGLGIAPSRSARWIRRSSAVRAVAEQVVRKTPLDALAVQWGERYWQQSVGRVAGTLQHDYATPTALKTADHDVVSSTNTKPAQPAPRAPSPSLS